MPDNKNNAFEVTVVNNEKKQLTPEQIAEIKRRRQQAARQQEGQKRELTPDEIAALKRRRELRAQREREKQNAPEEVRVPTVQKVKKKADSSPKSRRPEAKKQPKDLTGNVYTVDRKKEKQET